MNDDKELHDFMNWCENLMSAAFVLALIVVLLLCVTGCGGGGDDGPAPEDEKATWQPVNCQVHPEKCK